MMRPRTSTLVLGCPVIAVPLFLIDGWFAFEVVTGGLPLSVGLLVFLFACWLGGCWDQAARYWAWRREWDALDPNFQPRRPLQEAKWLVVFLVTSGLLFWGAVKFGPALADPHSPARAVAAMAIAALFLLWIVNRMIRRRPTRPAANEWHVTQAITRPLPAPSVAEAYARLPAYCRPLLSPEQARKEQS